MVPAAPRGHFLVAEQESNQRSRLKGQARAPARDAFPLRIPQPRVLQDGKIFRVGAGRRQTVILMVVLI